MTAKRFNGSRHQAIMKTKIILISAGLLLAAASKLSAATGDTSGCDTEALAKAGDSDLAQRRLEPDHADDRPHHQPAVMKLLSGGLWTIDQPTGTVSKTVSNQARARRS